MDQMTIEATRDVERMLNDAARERANGLGTTDADMMRGRLIEALAKIERLEEDAEDVRALRNELDGADIEIERLEDELADAKSEIADLRKQLAA